MFVDPVSVAEKVGVTPDTGLLFASFNVLVTVDAPIPSAPPGLVPVIVELAATGAPAVTVNELLVPVAAVFGVNPIAVIVKLPRFEMVTLWEASTPPTKVAVGPLPADKVPVELIVTCPVKPVTVALLTSCAVILMLKAVPAVCVPMSPPPAASTLNFVTRLVKVALTDRALFCMLNVQGLVEPEHVVVAKFVLQLVKADPPFAVAVSVPVAVLSLVVRLVHVAVIVAVAVREPVPGQPPRLTVPELTWIVTEPLPVPANVMSRLRAAATYGPTNGPPPPTGGAPAGWMKSVPVSASARAMLMRPLPV